MSRAEPTQSKLRYSKVNPGKMIVFYLCAQLAVLCTYNCLPGGGKDNIYIDMQAGRNLLPKLLVADNDNIYRYAGR